jgi:hypothetical protein
VDKRAIGLRLALPSVFVAATKSASFWQCWTAKRTTDEGMIGLRALPPFVEKQKHPRTSFILPQSRHPPSIE